MGILEVKEDYLRRANAVCSVSAIQNRYSMVARGYENMFKVCKELGVTFVAYSLLGNGILSGKYDPSFKFEDIDFRIHRPLYKEEGFGSVKKWLQLLEDLRIKKNCTSAQLSLAWMMPKEDFIVPIPGSKKLEKIEENFNSSHVTLTKDEVKQIDDLLDQINFQDIRH